MNLSPRAIALQGIGFTPALVAVQGLIGFDVGPPSGGGGNILWPSFPVFDDVAARRLKRRREEILILLPK